MAHELSVLSWNLFHGRDWPPNAALFTWRGRLLRRTLDDGVYAQVNRPLDDQFANWIAERDWQLCCLQECPPRWGDMLAHRCDAQALRVLTSRNFAQPLRRRLARWNPDLMASGEGGSNLIMVRRPWSVVAGSATSLVLNPFPRRGLRERRMLGAAKIAPLDDPAIELAVANFHGSANRPDLAAAEALRAGAFIDRMAGARAVILAGDFNLRPRHGDIYRRLEKMTGLSGITGKNAIDHILSRGLTVIEAPFQLASHARELDEQVDGQVRKIRLSDHAPVTARFRLGADAPRSG